MVAPAGLEVGQASLPVEREGSPRSSFRPASSSTLLPIESAGELSASLRPSDVKGDVHRQAATLPKPRRAYTSPRQQDQPLHQPLSLHLPYLHFPFLSGSPNAAKDHTGAFSNADKQHRSLAHRLRHSTSAAILSSKFRAAPAATVDAAKGDSIEQSRVTDRPAERGSSGRLFAQPKAQGPTSRIRTGSAATEQGLIFSLANENEHLVHSPVGQNWPLGLQLETAETEKSAMTLPQQHAGPSCKNPASISAPEGIYEHSAVIPPYNELPLNGNALPLGAVPTAASLLSVIGPSGNAGASGNATTITTPTSASSNADMLPAGAPLAATASTTSLSGSSLATSIPLHSVPPSWRKEIGQLVRPSLSTCAIRWPASGESSTGGGIGSSWGRKDRHVDAEDAANADGSRAGGQNDSSAGSSSNGKGAQGRPPLPTQFGSSSRLATGGIASHNAAVPDPPIEAVMVAQGIDAPASSTAGGLGGMLGMSALASYGFLPQQAPTGSEMEQSWASGGSNAATVAAGIFGAEKDPSAPYKPARSVAKPKNGIKQTSSSFVIRSQVHPDLKEILAQKERNGETDSMVITQRGRTLLWLADSSGTKEPLARVLFASPPSAHDINQLTRSPTTLDLVIGFPSGDILWMDMLTMRYSRINKGGIVSPSGIIQIRWLPCASPHEGLFITAHLDGTMMIWDREREDCEPGKGWSSRSWRVVSGRDESDGRQDSGKNNPVSGQGSGSVPHPGGSSNDAEMEMLADQIDHYQQHQAMSLSQAMNASPSRASRWLPGSSGGANAASHSGASGLPPVEWDPLRGIIVSRPGLALGPSGNDGPMPTPPLTPGLDKALNGAFFGGNQSTSMAHSQSVSQLGNDMPSPGQGSQAMTTSQTMNALGSSAGGGGLRLLGSQRNKFGVGGVGPEDADGNQASSASNAASGSAPGQSSGSAPPAIRWDKNPVSHWRVSRSKINDFAISPDLGCVAVVSEDSILRIIDLATERLIASHASYFGSFLSLAWSPDGRFLLTTSCDDLVSLYSPRDVTGGSRLLARFVGHSSWVRGAAFDPYRWKESDRMYRFGSVGEDGKICLWDFSGKSLGRPRGLGTNTLHAHTGGTTHPNSYRRSSSGHLTTHHHLLSAASLRSSSPFPGSLAHENVEVDVHHPAPSRSAIPTLQPIAAHQATVTVPSLPMPTAPGSTAGLGLGASVSTPNAAINAATLPPPASHLLSIRFRQSGVMVLHSTGVVETWLRPQAKVLRMIQDPEEDGLGDIRGTAQSQKATGAGAAPGRGRKGTLTGGQGIPGRGWFSRKRTNTSDGKVASTEASPHRVLLPTGESAATSATPGLAGGSSVAGGDTPASGLLGSPLLSRSKSRSASFSAATVSSGNGSGEVYPDETAISGVHGNRRPTLANRGISLGLSNLNMPKVGLGRWGNGNKDRSGDFAEGGGE